MIKFVDRKGTTILNGYEVLYIEWSPYKAYTKLATGVVTDKKISKSGIPRLELFNNFVDIVYFKYPNTTDYQFQVQIIDCSNSNNIPDRIVNDYIDPNTKPQLILTDDNFLDLFIPKLSNALKRNYKKFTLGNLQFTIRYSKNTLYCCSGCDLKFRGYITTSPVVQQILQQNNIKLSYQF